MQATDSIDAMTECNHFKVLVEFLLEQSFLPCDAMRIFAGVRWRGASNESGVVENCDFRFFRSLQLPNLHT